MNIINNYKIKKILNTILYSCEPNNSETIKAVRKIKDIGSPSLPFLIEVLNRKEVPEIIYSIIKDLISNETIHIFVKFLSFQDRKIVSEIVNILQLSNSYNPNILLELYVGNPALQGSLINILEPQKNRLSASNIQNLLNQINKENRTSILRLIENIATEDIIPGLIPWTTSDDWVIRLSIAKIISRFRSSKAEEALIKLLDDPHKSVRQTALENITTLSNPDQISYICKLICDPELTIQSKAIETIIRMNIPETVPYLFDLLQDESEYVRRGAVEVMNAVADTSAVKNLLQALRDKDWWVRVRAADALGTIGGPTVVDAVLELIHDKDAFIRRTAVEILNTTSDSRTFSALVEATKDEDWWVRERAIDALAKLDDVRSISVLIKLMGRDNETNRVIIRALSSLNDSQTLQNILSMVKGDDIDVAKDAIQALRFLTKESNAEMIEKDILKIRQGACQSLSEIADQTLKLLIQDFGDYVGYDQLSESATNLEIRRSHFDDKNLSTQTSDTAQANNTKSYESTNKHSSNLVFNIDTVEAGQMLQDRYRFIRRVGKGAFGTALLVEDTAVKEQIVLKFLHAQLSATEQLVKRFIRELRYARKITHENVIRIYDFLTFGHCYAISMEYFESHALSAYLQSNEKISQQTALKLMQLICSGMHVAHHCQVIHRDLKPANVLVNKKGVLKIVDFGLASAVSQEDSRVTRSGAMVGTPAYMSPEQIRGEELDPRTDIYSLGIIMYEVFTGKLPYTGKDAVSVIYQHVQGNATPPREICSNIDPTLESVIVKAMAVDKEKRFQSMEEVRIALSQLKVV